MTKEEKKEYNKRYYKENIEARKEYLKNNSGHIKQTEKEYNKKYYIKNKEKTKDYLEKNNDKIVEYRIKNKERKKEYDKLYNEKNKDKRNQKQSIKLKTNTLFKLKSLIRVLIGHTIRRKGYIKDSKTCEILGCSFEDFKAHLESQWEPWMSWDNYGNPKDGLYEPNKTWDVDHIVPVSSANTEEGIIALNHYTNLQPLCSYTNRFIKKDNLISS